MSGLPEGRAVLGRAATASQQIEKAVCFILHRHQAQRISIIAHPWGTIPAALFSGRLAADGALSKDEEGRRCQILEWRARMTRVRRTSLGGFGSLADG
jgi:hypothetical protein